MKTPAVTYPNTLTLAVSDLARGSARYGVTAYTMALGLAGAALLGSAFYKEITLTYASRLMGLRVGGLWQVVFLVAAMAWLMAVGLGLLCLMQKGRARSLGIWSLGVNVAAAVLAAVTML